MEIDKEVLDKLREYYPPKFFESPRVKRLMANKDFVANFLPEPEKPSYSHVLATPLVEVISVSIHNNQSIVDDGIMPYEIYGTIQVIDGEGSAFNLYDRKDYQPETIPIGGTLTLTVPKGRAITPSNVVEVVIDLKDRARNNAEIVKNSCYWDNKTEDDYDKVKTEVVEGVCGSAVVKYITYRHAAIATVEVMLLRGKDDGSCSNANVHGTIVAICGKNYSTILFDKQNESVKVKYGTCIRLCRQVVVVPAHSILKIVTNLWDTEKQIAAGDKEFPAGRGYSNEYFEGQNGLVEMEVQWSHAHMQSLLEKRLGESSSGNSIDDMFPVPKRVKLIPDQEPLSDLSMERRFLSDLKISFEDMGVMLLEVFSVSVCSDNDENFNIWGSVTYGGYLQDRYFLFDKDETAPVRLLRNQTVPIRSLKCYVDHRFEVDVDLTDVNGHLISRGDIVWDERDLRSDLWYDRPLCSVVRGDDGYYAAVHYSIFSTGFEAILQISILNYKSSCSFLERSIVYGSVCVEYSKWNYLTLYEKEYYRKKLFVSHLGDPPLQYSDSKILLSESVVAVPGISNLIVDVNLNMLVAGTGEVQIDEKLKPDETFVDRLEFQKDQLELKAGMSCKRQKKIEGTLQQLEVLVEWRNVYF